MIAGARNRRLALLDQHRRGAGRIEHQEVLAPLPDALLDQPQIEAVFAEHQANEARMRAEGVMKQREHAAFAVRLGRLTKRSKPPKA